MKFKRKNLEDLNLDDFIFFLMTVYLTRSLHTFYLYHVSGFQKENQNPALTKDQTYDR